MSTRTFDRSLAVDFSYTSANAAGATAGTAVYGLAGYSACTIYAALTGATGGTLDVYIQDTPDGGTTWTDYAHFTQIAAGASVIYRRWAVCDGAQVTTIATIGTGTSPALAANTIVGGPWGNGMRILTVAGAGTSAGAAQVLKLLFS